MEKSTIENTTVKEKDLEIKQKMSEMEAERFNSILNILHIN